MSLRYSTPHVHYPQFNSSRVCLPTNFQKFKCYIFYLCLSVCPYLWIIKFLELAYKKRGDMRGYFHRLGYWGFIVRLILLRFSFVFFINLPIRKSYRMVLSFRFWALWLLDFPPPPQFVNMTELLTTVIQVGGLTHHFLGKCLNQVGNMIVVF